MMGGLMFIGAVIICLVCNLPFVSDYSVYFVLLLALCFGAIGFIDDFCKLKKKQNMGLTSLQKALLQMAVSALFLYVMYRTGGMNCHLYIPFLNVTFVIHPIVYIFFAMFVMVGCVNSVNLTDGVDGLCSSVTIPVMVFFTAAAVALGKTDLAIVPAALVGGLAAYLIYNWHPAKVFMGDTGSLFLGGMIAALAYGYNMPIMLITLGFVFLMETLSDIIQVGYFKLSHGKRVFKMAPFHHHLEMGGWLGHKWKEKEIVALFTGISLVMAIISFIVVSKHYMGLS